MKLFASLTIAVALLVTPVLAQTSERLNPGAQNGPASNPVTQRTKARRGSDSPIGEPISGVRARPKPGANTSMDTTYPTITNKVQSGEVTGPNESRNAAQPAMQVPDAKSPSALPESMRIQQAADRANPPGPDLITPGGAASSQVPTAQTSDVEQNRLDTAAPSKRRVQIDDLSSVRPNSTAPTPNGGTGPSNGSSSGVSGTRAGVASPSSVGSSRAVSPTTVPHAASTSRSSSHTSSR